ncbi:hypothetical protein BX661DRAFT_180345 [Kickxella alabastrina]|uniref:uncharacterized protein n=1 Tax=Kickxella alabastrina TaxID=61397 RepID=UPI00221FC421|nr:uncharacterized protein BX661DRAFT_180345 [Kickxella alabastrina]KAI7830937.1 hypothetical protein BX661DRAFT_180345 [Kickxella alabastrina]
MGSGNKGSRVQPSQAMLSPHELANMYTRQFAMTKTTAPVPSIYQAAASAASSTANQTCLHGLTVLQCARSQAPVDPHRLKQSYRRLQRKKRNYMVQIIAFGILVLFTCKLLSAGSAYCIYLIVTNRRFLQSIKYPAQCNRSLHQFRMRFEANPMHAPSPFISQLSFFPTVPRQLRDGYLEFKSTYYRKRDAAKRRLQERLRREQQRKSSLSNASYKTNERKSKQRVGRQQHLRHPSSSHEGDSQVLGGRMSSNIADNNSIHGMSALLAGVDSATDEGSTTSSSIVSRRMPASGSTRRGGSDSDGGHHHDGMH